MKDTLQKLNLNTENSIVIGSGILQALGIRKSHDIDLVVTPEVFDSFKKSGKFEVLTKHNRITLKDGLFEIGMEWYVLDKHYKLEDFVNESVIIDEVRYISLDFLYLAKRSWIEEKTARPKDINDIKLIEEYKKNGILNYET